MPWFKDISSNFLKDNLLRPKLAEDSFPKKNVATANNLQIGLKENFLYSLQGVINTNMTSLILKESSIIKARKISSLSINKRTEKMNKKTLIKME